MNSTHGAEDPVKPLTRGEVIAYKLLAIMMGAFILLMATMSFFPPRVPNGRLGCYYGRNTLPLRLTPQEIVFMGPVEVSSAYDYEVGSYSEKITPRQNLRLNAGADGRTVATPTDGGGLFLLYDFSDKDVIEAAQDGRTAATWHHAPCPKG